MAGRVRSSLPLESLGQLECPGGQRIEPGDQLFRGIDLSRLRDLFLDEALVGIGPHRDFGRADRLDGGS